MANLVGGVARQDASTERFVQHRAFLFSSCELHEGHFPLGPFNRSSGNLSVKAFARPRLAKLTHLREHCGSLGVSGSMISTNVE